MRASLPLLSVLLLGAMFASSANAQTFVTPASYTATAGEGQAQGGTYNYFDDTGRQLTDGILGVNDWQANLGNGNAYEWVGWRVAEPTFTFTFAQPVSLSQVQISFNRNTGAAINLPTNVTVAGVSSSVSQNALTDATRGFLSFATNFTGTSLTVSLADNNTNQFIFVDEVRFVTAAPEPASLALLLTTACGVASVLHRRKK